MRALFPILLVLALGAPSRAVVAQTNPAAADTCGAGLSEAACVRGLAAEPEWHGGRLRSVANGLLWLPRTGLDHLLDATARGTYRFDEAGVVDRVDAVLTFGGGSFHWYPVIDLSSGSQTSLGAAVGYRGDRWKASLGGAWGGSEVWRLGARFGADFRPGGRRLSFLLHGHLRHRDDYRFYGFGSDPRTDPRNRFLAPDGPDYGVFAQHLSRAELVAGLELTRTWSFRASLVLGRREILPPGVGAADGLLAVFDPAGLPGLGEGHQRYQEIALVHDTRRFRRRIMPGVRLETYGGLSEGFDGDPVRFARYGADLALYFPVLGRDRVIVPRLIFDAVQNRNDNAPIALADYPRQRTWRGSSSAHLLRTDDKILMPSLDYQWPLTYRLDAHLFCETILVAGPQSDLSFDHAPWDAGFGLVVQKEQAELAQLALAHGSQGWRFFFTFGFSRTTNERTSWQ